MPIMNFDLEDGLPPVSFSINGEGAERMMNFMSECQQSRDARAMQSAEIAELRAKVESLAAPAVANGAVDERVAFKAHFMAVGFGDRRFARYNIHDQDDEAFYMDHQIELLWQGWRGRAAIDSAQEAAPNALTDEQLADIWINRDCMDAIRAGDIRAQFICAARAALAAAGVA